MSLTAYSTVLSVLILLLGTATLLSMLGAFYSATLRKKLADVAYETWILLIGILATMATLGALIFQYQYLTPVCSLCWWQRIFMFPIEIVVAVSLYTKAKTNHLITGILAAIGALFASYHFYAHFQKYVLGNTMLIPCSPTEVGEGCSNAPVITFDFITIPFMALVVFVTLMWLSYLAHKKAKAPETM